jgi:heme-degrading monooxygenase HmoA
MLLERSELKIKAGQEADFASVMQQRGLPMLASFPGVSSVRIGRGVENPGKFLLLVTWDAMDAHTAFRNSPIYAPFRQLFAPYSEGGSMEHFDML